MASPQLENGYTRIANEILDHLVCAGFSGHEIEVLLFVMRKTYGFGKKKDKISISQFQVAMGISDRSQICRILKKLVARKPLVKENNLYSFNKNWQEWLVASTPQWHRSPQVVASESILLVASKPPTKERDTKETYSKERPADKSADTTDPINQIFDIFFETINPQINYGQKSWRKAASDLIKAYGLESLIEITRVACSIQGQEFAPTITNPYQLKEKMAALQIFIKKSQQPKKGMIQSL